MNPNAIPPSWNTIAKCVAAYQAGDKAKAFGGISKMKIKVALTKEEHKVIAVAADFLNGMGRLWAQMGWKEQDTIERADQLFKDKFMK